MSDQPITPPVDRTGRLDLLAQDGLGQLADQLGKHFGIPLRSYVQPVIDRFVREKVDHHRMPVTPTEIAERVGILENPARKKRRRNR